MKIKIGTITEEIVRLNNEIYRNVDGGKERLSVELKNAERTVESVNQLMTEHFKGELTYCDDDGTEEVFAGYEVESVRKFYDTMGRQITVEFVKGE